MLEFLEKTGEPVARRDQRRHVRARALGPRSDPAGRGRSRSSATSSRGSPATVSTGRCSTATGWTSARPSATCRRPGTSSRGGSRPWSSRPAPACTSIRAAEIAESAILGPRAVLGPRCRLESGAEVRESVLLEGCTAETGARIERLDPLRGRTRWRPARRLTAPSSVGMKESSADDRARRDARGRPRDPRPPARRALAGRVGPPRARPSPPGWLVCGMGGSAIGGDLAAAALGDRLRRPLVDSSRLPVAELGSLGLDRALLQLLGRDGGDTRLLRGGRPSSAPGGSSRAPAARSPT